MPVCSTSSATVHPLLVGEGASLFDGISGDRHYEIADTQQLADGSTAPGVPGEPLGEVS